jgi:hypothetical protein
MNGTAAPIPNYHIGRRLPPQSELANIPSDPIMSLACPFTDLAMVNVPIWCDYASLGIRLHTCVARSRVYISDIEPGSTCSNIREWRCKYKGAYVVQINGHPVFSKASALQQLTNIVRLDPTLSTPMLELIPPPTPLPPTYTPLPALLAFNWINSVQSSMHCTK